MPSWLTTMLSVIAGGMLTMVSAWLADRRLAHRDRERRSEERHERVVMRRNDFQRETLLALQVTSQKLLRKTGEMLQLDIVAHRTSGKWQKQLLPDGIASDHLHLTTETMLLASRVRDDEVRTLADQFRSEAAIVGQSQDEHEAENRMMVAANRQQALIQRIGLLVRELDKIG